MWHLHTYLFVGWNLFDDTWFSQETFALAVNDLLRFGCWSSHRLQEDQVWRCGEKLWCRFGHCDAGPCHSSQRVCMYVYIYIYTVEVCSITSIYVYMITCVHSPSLSWADFAESSQIKTTAPLKEYEQRTMSSNVLKSGAKGFSFHRKICFCAITRGNVFHQMEAREACRTHMVHGPW